MTNPRRDVFIFAAKPGEREESIQYVTDWLESLKGHPGYLGGAILRETADELFEDVLFVVTMDFADTESARALWPKIDTTINPLYSDIKSENKEPDQAPRFFDGTKERVAAGAPLDLKFNRGDGRLARMLHLHAEVANEVTAELVDEVTA